MICSIDESFLLCLINCISQSKSLHSIHSLSLYEISLISALHYPLQCFIPHKFSAYSMYLIFSSEIGQLIFRFTFLSLPSINNIFFSFLIISQITCKQLCDSYYISTHTYSANFFLFFMLYTDIILELQSNCKTDSWNKQPYLSNKMQLSHGIITSINKCYLVTV